MDPFSLPHALDMALGHYQAGRLQQAEQICRRIVQADTRHVDALYLLGLIAARTARDDLTSDCLNAVLRLKPDFADAHNILGIVLVKQRKLAEAAESFRRALHANPHHAMAHSNLGNALKEQGELDAAVSSFREALRLKPDFPEAYNNLGSILQQQGRFEEAESCLRQALRLKPDSAEVCFNLGILLWKLERVEDAIACNQRAVQLKPDYAEAHANLGNGLMERSQLDDAIAAYRVALRLKPDDAHVHSNLVRILHYHPGYDLEAIRDECRRWNARHAEPLTGDVRPHANLPDPERRLRIGYVSPDFRDHADAFFVVPLLSSHDHRQFEIFCYAHVARPDALTGRLRGYADVWRNIVGHSDAQIADTVRDDRIDILVDLKLHTADNRLQLFARKPAPVQVTWLGYPGTTGLSTVDYRLTDPYLDPPGLFDAYYTEESLRLPDTFWCYDPLTDGPSINALPALESGALTFGCLNNFCKVNDGCLALWARVLRDVPHSRLLLQAPRGPARDKVLARLHREGIAAGRVQFADKHARPEYLKLYQHIDLCLDPLPYNGHTTSLDAFWMGVPTVTMVGETAVGRAGWSQLCNLDLKELAAETPDEYVTLAAKLAADLPCLQELRRTLRERMTQSPLMDANRFARNVESAYRQMWRRWCLGRQTSREWMPLS
jgi:predicted O-linked N-acetylglucosamine transferase (SPINDLY family)